MAKFIAIPVGQGDAFYLERKEASILVDGGRGAYYFPEMFRTHTNKCHANILICTHNDADHANGILGFLKGGLGCDEIWLPGRWLGVLPEVLHNVEKVYGELYSNVKECELRGLIRPGHRELEAYSDTLKVEIHDDHESDQVRTNLDQVSEIGTGGWPIKYMQQLEQAKPWGGPPWGEDMFLHAVLMQHIRGLGSSIHLIKSAIEAAHLIREIAIEAYHRGIKVRWFEYNAACPSGGEAFLIPVNSREQNHVWPLRETLLDCLALTVSNRESLVFWSPGFEQTPGVLFTADSDLNCVNLESYNLRDSLITAPHHGSENNRNVYEIVNTAAGDYSNSLRWVRSDGRYRSRPGGTYLDIPSGRRFCTLCRHVSVESSQKQRLHFFVRRGSWNRCQTRECSCQKA